MGNLPPANMHTAKGLKKSGGFKFRWWMAVILIAVIAVIGIAVLRFSRASAIPPEEMAKIQAGIIIDSGITGATVKYPPYNYERHFNLAEAVKAQQDPAEYQKLMNLVIADLEQIYVKQHPAATTPSTTSSRPANTTTPPSTTSPATSDQSAQPTTQAPQATTDTTGQTSSNTTQTASYNSSNQPQDLGTLSGYLTFNYNTQGQTDIKSVSLLVDNTIVGVDKSAPYQFSFDSRRFSNGEHSIKAVTINNDDSTKTIYYKAKFNNATVFDRFLYPISAPWWWIFRS